MGKQKELKPKADLPSEGELIAKIDEELAIWDRLDNHGSSQNAQANCRSRIEVLRKQLKELHGREY